MSFVILTAVDDNIVNQRALNIFLDSIQVNSPEIKNQIIVLIPKTISSFSNLSNDLKKREVQIFQSKIQVKENDPYFVKFMIKEFVELHGDEQDAIVYLDPDHIVLKKFIPAAIEGSFYVSSEVSILKDRNVKWNNDSLKKAIKSTNHFNTSILIGKSKTWKSIINRWEEVYFEIEDSISFRYREEIAFSVAAHIEKLHLIPCSLNIQGGFHSFTSDTTLFHYGGEYKEAIEFKKILKEDPYFVKYMSKQEALFLGKNGTWLINKITEILKKHELY